MPGYPAFFFDGKTSPCANIWVEAHMKKTFLLCMILLLSLFVPSAQAATGHKGFSEIVLAEEGKLLAEITDAEIQAGYNALGRKFFGWKHYFFTYWEDATYKGEVIFAKSNRTGQPIEINYVLQEKEYTENSWKVKGSISGKVQGKIKKIDFALNADAEGEKKDTESFTRFEETKFKILLEPNHRLVLQITGECTVTNGVSKHFLFGICSKKGVWEYVEVVTRYYELRTMEIEE